MARSTNTNSSAQAQRIDLGKGVRLYQPPQVIPLNEASGVSTDCRQGTYLAGCRNGEWNVKADCDSGGRAQY